jgi:DNA-binding transcriptional LysR family regulator
MEQAAGAPLFERLVRGVRPTTAGNVLLRHAAVLLERVDAATLELAGLRDRLEGRLVVGAYPSALVALVPRALARVLRAHPALAVVLREGSTPTHLRRLRAGHLEVAVVALDRQAPPALDDLRVEQLLEGRLLVAVPATHRLAQRGTVDAAELTDEPWIVGDADPLLDVWPRPPATRRVAYTVRDWRARLGLVAAGLGITPVPTVAVGTIPPGIRLLAVDEPQAVLRSVVAVTRPEPSPSALALLRALREEAALIAETARQALEP